MALTSTEKKEIEVIVRKELKDFLGSNTMKQFEEKMLELIIKELKRGKVGTEVRDIVVKIFSVFFKISSYI